MSSKAHVLTSLENAFELAPETAAVWQGLLVFGDAQARLAPSFESCMTGLCIPASQAHLIGSRKRVLRKEAGICGYSEGATEQNNNTYALSLKISDGFFNESMLRTTG